MNRDLLKLTMDKKILDEVSEQHKKSFVNLTWSAAVFVICVILASQLIFMGGTSPTIIYNLILLFIGTFCGFLVFKIKNDNILAIRIFFFFAVIQLILNPYIQSMGSYEGSVYYTSMMIFAANLVFNIRAALLVYSIFVINGIIVSYLDRVGFFANGYYSEMFFLEFYKGYFAGNSISMLICFFYNKMYADKDKEIQRLAQELIDNKIKENELSRVKEMQTISGQLAHEINNPLMIISASLHKIKKSDNYDVENIEKIEKSTKRMAAVIIELKSLANIISLEDKEDINVSNVLNSILDNYHLKKNIERALKNDLTFNCDQTHLSNILKEIIENADEKESGNNIKIVAFEDNQSKKIIIEDDGDPIAFDDPNDIFKSFATNKIDKTKVRGLGLTKAMEYARLNNLKLSADSNNERTQFILEQI